MTKETVRGMLLGAGLMFLLIAGLLLIVFHPISSMVATGAALIANVTIWSPLFWGVGIGVVVVGVLGMKLLQTKPKG